MEKATDDLLEALNLPKELFENSIMFLMEKGYDQQLMITQANIIQTLRLHKVLF